jgi:hypothetical protein
MSTCLSPFEYFINYAEWYIAENPGTTFSEVLNQVNVFPTTAGLCCPSCGTNTNIPYVLSGRFDTGYPSNFFSFFQGLFPLNGECCLNTHVTLEIYDIIKENSEWSVTGDIADLPKPCCTTSDFKNCVTELATFLNSPDFNEYISDYNNQLTGIAEWGLIGGDSLLCNIYETLYLRTPLKSLEYILDILDYGLVIQCTGTSVIITSISTYVTTYLSTLCFSFVAEGGTLSIETLTPNTSPSTYNGKVWYSNSVGHAIYWVTATNEWVYDTDGLNGGVISQTLINNNNILPISTSTYEWTPACSILTEPCITSSVSVADCPTTTTTSTTTASVDCFCQFGQFNDSGNPAFYYACQPIGTLVTTTSAIGVSVCVDVTKAYSPNITIVGPLPGECECIP